ncbi:MAG: NAD(P)H-dependent glycerol-3-phosphate dehydrogenase [Nitrospinales bacterium]
MKKPTIGVIGAGAWGTALSLLLAENNYELDLWVREAELCDIMEKKRENTLFLPGFPLPRNIRPLSSLEKAAAGKSVLFMVTPTHALRQTAEKLAPHLEPNCLIVNASKGIEHGSLSMARTILKETVKTPCRTGSISGPTFALEIAKRVPSALVAAASDLETAARIQEILSGATLKVFTSTDVTGVELGGALKNVIAIATGVADGLGLGFNTRAALITRGLVEMTRIGTTLGARPETFSGLSGLGDLVLTCTGDLSRNRTVGLKLGRGDKLRDITQNMNVVAEGLHTVKAAHDLKNQLNIQASIIDETYKVLYEEKPARQALADLLKVEISTEFEGIKGLHQ